MKKKNSVFDETIRAFKNLDSIEIAISAGPRSKQFQRLFEESIAVEAGDSHLNFSAGADAIKSVILPVTITHNILKSLRICRGTPAFFCCLPRTLDVYVPAFAHLRYLFLDIERVEFYAQHRMKLIFLREVSEGIGHLARAASGLESLHISIGTWETEFESDPKSKSLLRWDLIVGDTTWQNLRTLELACVAGDENLFSGFIERHVKTLKKLSWDNMFLMGDPSGYAWLRVWKNMHTQLNLEELTFRGVWAGTRDLNKRRSFKPEMRMDKGLGELLANYILRRITAPQQSKPWWLTAPTMVTWISKLYPVSSFAAEIWDQMSASESLVGGEHLKKYETC